MTDGSRISRSVKSGFSTINVHDSSKFGRNLANFPAWHMWQKRYTTRKNSSFKEISDARQVEHIADALTVDAQRFFYEFIYPRLGQAPSDLEATRLAQNTGSHHFGRGALSLSTAFRMLEERFCTRDAGSVLRQELVSLTLAKLKSEFKCSRTDALRQLKRPIGRFSANGPQEYRSETCKINVFIDCLKNERWALSRIIACKSDPANQKLQTYVDALINFVHLSENMVQTPQTSGILHTDASPECFDE